jgi:hypothetical protein
MWLDASQDTARANGSTISSYTSHSASAKVLAAPAGKEPIFRANVGGKPRIEFNAKSVLRLANYQPATTGQTWVMLVRKIAQPTAGYFELVAYQTSELRIAGGGTTLQSLGDTGHSGPTISLAFDPGIGVDCIYWTECNVTTRIMRLWTNTTLQGTSAATLPSPNNRPAANLNIGSRDNNDLYLNGYVAEVLVFDGPVADADRIAVTAYLTAKWGVTALGAGDFGKPAPKQEN